MTDDLQKAAVVTGVSTGIGRAIAQNLIARGWRVFGSVRKQSDASEAKATLGPSFTPLIFDVTDDAGVKRAADEVRDALGGATLRGLVNNAGIAVAGPALHIPLDEVKHQFDVNVYGPIRVTQAFAPLLGARKDFAGIPGKIVNMSSVAGKMASPFMSPYAMSKHALEALSDALRRELSLYGVDVIIVGPGAIKTPIWDKADDINAEQYKATDFYELLVGLRSAMKEYGDAGLPPEDVGALVGRILEREATAPRYAILRNKFAMWTLPRLLPTRIVDKAVLKRFGFPAHK